MKISATTVITVSDSCARGEGQDVSGPEACRRLADGGFDVEGPVVVPDEVPAIAEALRLATAGSRLVVTTGGTGLTGRDSTPEAVQPLFDKTIEGFGEVFRMLSYELIKTSTIQSRAIAGLANGTPIFCLPGSPGACKDGWDGIIQHQLDVRHKPCNLVELMPRFREQ